MAKKSPPAPSPLTFDLPVSLLSKIEVQRKKLGLASTSEVVRYALAEFDLSEFASTTEARRQISVRLPAQDKAMLVKAAKKQKASLGEILRAAVESLPEKNAAEKKAVAKVTPAKSIPVKSLPVKMAPAKKVKR